MNILLLGSGGREHALAWKISQSHHCNSLFIAPGNPGTAQYGENISIDLNDFPAIAAVCRDKKIEMVVVGPEDPLVNGVYDFFQEHASLSSIIVVGPSAAAAQLEGSKAFAKAFMQRNGIPTAAYREFTVDTYNEGVLYISSHALPIVLKADGLAAGKGVVIAQSHEEAMATFQSMIKDAQFGKASERVVIEQFLTGVELSVFALTDGRDFVLLPEAKDYKRIGEADSGLNTGGMGAVSPVPFAQGAFMEKVVEKVVRSTIAGLEKEGLVYHGFVFFGLINVNGEPYVIEYNCRMGDPETEVVMPRLQTDLIELFLAMQEGRLSSASVNIDPRSAATVVVVSGGYPGTFEKGKVIDGIESAGGEQTLVFYAGIAEKEGRLVTSGGRVAAITSYGETIAHAVDQSLSVIQQFSFENMVHRRDIGYEFKI
ncbi:MAG: phosphoribosylamine--glycine ligase [Bacteroidetes bacterium]|nr:phosphoribosylamine--glycine ligase [Bacteroidota bacterium]